MTNAPFKLLGLDHVVLRVTDLEGMARFYSDVLGCFLERCQPELGLHQLRAGRSLIDLVTVSGKLGQRGGVAPASEGRNVDHLAIAIARSTAEPSASTWRRMAFR